MVAAGAAQRCEIQVAYAIGVARPVSLLVETFGTAAVDPDRIARPSTRCSTCVRRPSSGTWTCAGPIYRKTAAYGHFGRTDKEFSWEQVTRLDDFKSALGL